MVGFFVRPFLEILNISNNLHMVLYLCSLELRDLCRSSCHSIINGKMNIQWNFSTLWVMLRTAVVRAKVILSCWHFSTIDDSLLENIMSCLLLRSSTLSRRKYKLLDSELLYITQGDNLESLYGCHYPRNQCWTASALSGKSSSQCQVEPTTTATSFSSAPPHIPPLPSSFSLSPHFLFLLYPPFSASQVLKLQACVPLWFMWCWGPNPGPHAG